MVSRNEGSCNLYIQAAGPTARGIRVIDGAEPPAMHGLFVVLSDKTFLALSARATPERGERAAGSPWLLNFRHDAVLLPPQFMGRTCTIGTCVIVL